MALFRRSPKPAPAPKPHVFIEHDTHRLEYVTSRFFLSADRFISESTRTTKDGMTTFCTGAPLPNREAYQSLQRRLYKELPVRSADSRTEMIRIYPQYLAVMWYIEDVTASDKEQFVEEQVCRILAEHFDWKDPHIGRLKPSDNLYEVASSLGADWRLGRY